MKKLILLALFAVALLLSGCASGYVVTPEGPTAVIVYPEYYYPRYYYSRYYYRPYYRPYHKPHHRSTPPPPPQRSRSQRHSHR